MKIKMKKALCVLFAIILVCAGLSACGKSPCYAKITYSDGSSEMLDMKDMKELDRLYRENEYAYKKKYKKYSGNKIEIVDRVKNEVRVGTPVYTSWGWTLYLGNNNPILVDLRKGTLIKVTGELYGDRKDIFVDTIVIIEEE